VNLRAFFFVTITALVEVDALVNQVEPFAQPEPQTDSEKTPVKFKPQLVVSYGCKPYPAVQADSSVSAGLFGPGSIDGECDQGSPLGSQVYSRSAWFHDKWAIMYAWYLPKGRSARFKRRHMWLSAVVWIDDPALANSTIAALNYGMRQKVQQSNTLTF
jgi:hypothetical protein